MNPAILAVISVDLSQSDGSYQPNLSIKRKPRTEVSWLRRKRKARLLRLFKDDAERKAMTLPINEDRNERRWKAYFKLIGG